MPSAKWKSLYGSSLSFDERFFAIMLWAWTSDNERFIRRLRERSRQLASDAGRGDGSAIRPVRHAASVGGAVLPGLSAARSLSAALEPMRGFQGMLGLSSTAGLLSGHSAMGSLIGGSPMANLLRPHRSEAAFQTLIGGTAVRDGLRSLARGVADVEVTRAKPPPGFASVLRPYASNPYSAFNASESLRSALRAPTSMFGLSDAVTKAMRGIVEAPGVPGTRGRPLTMLGREVFSAALGGRLGEQLKVTFGRSLVDERSRLLFGADGASSLFPVVRGSPAWTGLAGLGDVLAPMRELSEMFAELGEFMRIWEDDPLWFLLSVFEMRAARRFAGLTRDQVEQALLGALADVVTDGEFVAALRELVRDAPYLTPHQRQWLDHGLEHAAAGEWVQAAPPVLAGLEGALHAAAIGTALIVERGGKFIAAEKLVKNMALSDEYTAFVVRRVLGGIGNSFRHGRADSGERDQVLFAIIALAGWVDYFLDLYSMGVLVDLLIDRPDDAIERVTEARAQMTAGT